MLKLFESFKGTKVLSLRVGGLIGYALEPIINPNNLHIEGWYVEDSQSKEILILLSQDIRDILPQGIAVDDHEVLSDPDDLVRLKDILELDFHLTGMKVQSVSGKHFGKVTDYAFETTSFYVQKIYATQAIVRNLSGGNISVDRSQSIEITNKRIVIDDATEKAKKPLIAPSPAG